MTISRIAVAAVLVFAVAAAIYGAFAIRDRLTLGTDCSEFEFSPHRWHSQPGSERFTRSGPRTEQANALLDCNVLIGMSHASVRRMLGPPQRPSPQIPETREALRREWNYVVGAGLVDPLVLAIRFGDKERVTEVLTY